MSVWDFERGDHFHRVGPRSTGSGAYAAVLLGSVLLWLLAGGQALAGSASGPRPGVQPLTAAGQMQIDSADRCPVCAMKVAKHPQTACAIQLSDVTTFYFCGSGCLIKSWLHPEIFLNRSRPDLQRAVVRDYFSGRPADATAVTWVAGSDVVGPMGPAIVAVADAGQLAVFKKRHGGKVTFRLAEVTDDLWMAITGKTILPRKDP